MQFAHFEFDPASDRLGEGPLSEVYKAVDLRLGRTVALKILRAHAEIDPQADRRFHREARHTSALTHPNIATVYEYGKDQGTSFIAMEYLQGRTLDQIIKDQTLGYEESLRIGLQVTEALAVVHKHGLIHRDLKPGNVMVLDDGQVRLLDFGIARASDEANITQHGMLVGTVLYMSPEQVRGQELDPRSDVFALGSVLYHVMTTALPFSGGSFPEVCMAILDGNVRRPSQVRLGFPRPLEDFLMRCLKADPAERYADGEEAHGALLAAAEALKGGAAPAAVANVSGTILVPPVLCSGTDTRACALLAGSLRKDLAAELGRVRGLCVELIDGFAPPPGAAFDYVLRTELWVESTEGTLDVRLESRNNGTSELHETSHDRIRHSDADEWSLQATLVRSAVRAVRRRLSDLALRPDASTSRKVAESVALARRAHDVLHRGTTKHLLSSISSFRRAIEADPYCALAYAGLAEALVRKYLYWDGDASFLEEARENSSRALALDPRCAEAHTAMGFEFHMSGHATDAQREYQVAIQMDRDEWLAHHQLGALRAREGNFKHAAPLLQRAIALKPTHIGSYDHLFTVLQRMDRYEESLQIADKGIQAARAHLADVPDNQEARTYLATLLARMGLADEARREARSARQLSPKDGYTAFHAACAFALLGDFVEAMDALTQAQERGFFIQSELVRNADLDVLRGLPEFQALTA
jgi:tetratricopeptide (TPR) repeat protein/predicted Ser/Thr protein kinase